MPRVSQLPEEVLANLREDRLLSYMEEFDKADPEAIFEKTYIEEESVKEAEENLNTPGGNQKEELTRLKKEVKEARREAKQNADNIIELQGERDQYMQAFAKLHLQTGGRGDSEEGTPRPTLTPKSTKLPKGAKLSDGVNPTFESWLIDVEGTLKSNADYYPNAKD
ncbi:hypothetical protein TSTA_005930 [Talaromyces stipitatus ATCC 10500]|uniref:Uncharacterized protein n=1 Tax=Talaromyces stipitatus (strain ATCC 10500 / CBS 375.48 / QM 6759 / NRRL 1006) TaxID=441959 RepID=B8MTS8_TALSN|nr:uncharacterized protein TSTA_005930 [Talaromyces stipitatus ATCC 10500]EED12563.1 hypothetical protein TSTA_005930 [Talaromyces stipitatus ATCC 10500]